ncbi:hypothetical protein AcV5_003593 [Taiwanofungus camphoratus]|nr:hypothetical protein AcV5_003593 [Antrodia cinnamomea]
MMAQAPPFCQCFPDSFLLNDVGSTLHSNMKHGPSSTQLRLSTCAIPRPSASYATSRPYITPRPATPYATSTPYHHDDRYCCPLCLASHACFSIVPDGYPIPSVHPRWSSYLAPCSPMPRPLPIPPGVLDLHGMQPAINTSITQQTAPISKTSSRSRPLPSPPLPRPPAPSPIRAAVPESAPASQPNFAKIQVSKPILSISIPNSRVAKTSRSKLEEQALISDCLTPLVFHMPSPRLRADPALDGTRSETSSTDFVPDDSDDLISNTLSSKKMTSFLTNARAEREPSACSRQSSRKWVVEKKGKRRTQQPKDFAKLMKKLRKLRL